MVATPIGNLADMGARAQAVLLQVDVVAAEDTRHTGQLLSALGIRKPMISVHDHNERARSQEVVKRLQAGESVAYVSDAGTPAISDPGALLVQAVAAEGIKVVSVPGASAVLTAIAASGLDVRAGFCFLGFLPTTQKAKLAWQSELAQSHRVSVFFEAPHRIMDTLAWLAEVFPQRQLVLAKELTKLHERFVRGTTTEVLALMQAHKDWQRGEFVLLLAPAEKKDDVDEQTLSLMQVLQPLLVDLPLSQAVKLTCAITGQKKKQVYDLALQWQQKNQ
ncbi:MAG: 16S rRNA (cytidine(1402)-2'-O)-methyltransferase [Gammaproteobacteria bacterium]|nr:16S rRNA (cytidine(1402)-2'-O)-methyltransferase [Gammaproteobacteria bacterium]